MNELRQFQREYEKSYLDEHRGKQEQNIDATVELLGLYHFWLKLSRLLLTISRLVKIH